MLNAIVAAADIITPLALLILGTVVWKYRQSFERKIKLEEQLREERIGIYDKVLEPFIIIFMPEAAWELARKNKNDSRESAALKLMTSVEYRNAAFKLYLIGSDTVVSSYNDLFQYFYSLNNKTSGGLDISTAISLYGAFLLEIRKSMGNEHAKIDKWGMLKGFINDVEKYQD